MTSAFFQALIGSGGYDADYQAILDYSNSQLYTSSSTAQKTKENAAMVAIKAVFGVANIADAPILQGLMFATDGDSDFATISWRDPTNAALQAEKVNSPTHSSDGFNSNGTSSYLKAKATTSNINQSNFSIAARAFQNAGQNGVVMFGVGDDVLGSAEQVFLNPRNGSDIASYRTFGDNTSETVVSTEARDRWIIARNGNFEYHSINGAAFVSSANTANAAEISRDTYLLAYNGSVGATSFYTQGISYFWVFTRKLTDQEAADFDAAMVNYLS